MARLQISGIAIALLMAVSAKADPSYTEFDVRGAISTVASSINDSGTIAGYYQTLVRKCAGGCGYMRAADGTISTFKIKGCESNLLINDINASGELVGLCRSKESAFSFIRSADGSISRVSKMRGSSPNLYKISDNGIAGGVFFQSGSQPFFRMPDGSKHLLKGAKRMLGEIGGINATGVSTGLISAYPGKAFIYVLGEKLQEFSVPNFYGALGDAINDAGDVAGIC